MDERLTKTDLRVLGVILSFRNKDTNLCWPKREQIAQRCGLAVRKISAATSHLVELGWLIKEGAGGRSLSCQYRLTVPEITLKDETLPNSGTVTESSRVLESKTLPNSGTKTLPNSGTKTLPNSGRGIKQTNEQTNEQTKRVLTYSHAREEKPPDKKNPKKKYSGIDLTNLPDEISADVAVAFIDYRKKLKVPISQRGFSVIVAEAMKARSIGMSPERALDEVMAAGWRGLKVDWLQNRARGSPGGAGGGLRNRQAEIERANREVGQQWLNDFDGEVYDQK